MGLRPQRGHDVDAGGSGTGQSVRQPPAEARTQKADADRASRSCARRSPHPVATPRWPQFTACCTASTKLSDVGPIPNPQMARPMTNKERRPRGNGGTRNQNQVPHRNQGRPNHAAAAKPETHDGPGRHGDADRPRQKQRHKRPPRVGRIASAHSLNE